MVQPCGRVVFSTGDLTRRAASSSSRSGYSIASVVGSALDGFFSVLFPGNCRLCSTPLIRLSGLPVCDPCLDDIAALGEADPVCWACGERLLGPPEPQRLCLECTRLAPPFRRAMAYGSYDGGLRELIHLLKYERVRSAAPVLGRMLAEAALGLRPEFTAPPLVIPVPLHAGKLRQRGFNQAELIARALLKNVGDWKLELDATILERRRATGSQIGLSRAQRQQNLRGAFAVGRAHAVAGRDILLVDDVYTTGTTVTECTRVLRRAGADNVWVVTVARVLKRVTASVSLDREDWDMAASNAAAPRARAAQA